MRLHAREQQPSTGHLSPIANCHLDHHRRYLELLRNAGLGSLPGTAAEVLDDQVCVRACARAHARAWGCACVCACRARPQRCWSTRCAPASRSQDRVTCGKWPLPMHVDACKATAGGHPLRAALTCCIARGHPPRACSVPAPAPSPSRGHPGSAPAQHLPVQCTHPSPPLGG